MQEQGTRDANVLDVFLQVVHEDAPKVPGEFWDDPEFVKIFINACWMHTVCRLQGVEPSDEDRERAFHVQRTLAEQNDPDDECPCPLCQLRRITEAEESLREDDILSAAVISNPDEDRLLGGGTNNA